VGCFLKLSGMLFKACILWYYFPLNNQLLPIQRCNRLYPDQQNSVGLGDSRQCCQLFSVVKREILLVKKQHKLYGKPWVISVAGGWIPVLRTRKKVDLRSGLFAGPIHGCGLHNVCKKENLLCNLWTNVG